MKMIGISDRSATRFCRSKPLRSGRATSSIRQFGTGARGQARNSRAEANVSGCQPAQRMSNSSDSRTETSSSTTNTTGVACSMCDDLDYESRALAQKNIYIVFPRRGASARYRSIHSKRGIQRLKQVRIAERLEQEPDGALLEHAWADGTVSVGG